MNKGSLKLLGLAVTLTCAGLMSVKTYADDSSSGCGLGWMLFKKNSLVSSYSRAATNATFSSTFGMTSGTSGCAAHSIVKNDKLPEYFVETHLAQLQTDLMLGQGVYLQAFALGLGCQEQEFSQFEKSLRNHADKYQLETTNSSGQFLQSTRSIIQENNICQDSTVKKS